MKKQGFTHSSEFSLRENVHKWPGYLCPCLLELFEHVPSRIMLYFDLVFGNDGQSAQNLYIESHIRDY